MRGIVLAWMAGIGILAWRDAQQYHQPPVPGRILGASVVFAVLALVAEYEPATRFATLAAWGFDVAVLLSIGPQSLTSTAGFGGPASSANRPVRPATEQQQSQRQQRQGG